MEKPKILVVLSGGQDSTTCLYLAVSRVGAENVCAVTFDYGQRHSVEIDAALSIALELGISTHEVIDLPEGILKSTSPLVSTATLEQYADYASLPGGIEKTFVPMRNQLFITLAFNRAVAWGCHSVMLGVCEEDYGGYPDCRQEFIDHIARACNKGLPQPEYILIDTPLMRLTKAQTVQLALQLPGCYEALAFTHTAYDGSYPPVGKDHATLLREKGFALAGVPDPLVLRAVLQGRMVLPDAPNYTDRVIASVKDRLPRLYPPVAPALVTEGNSDE